MVGSQLCLLRLRLLLLLRPPCCCYPCCCYPCCCYPCCCYPCCCYPPSLPEAPGGEDEEAKRLGLLRELTKGGDVRGGHLVGHLGVLQQLAWLGLRGRGSG